MEKLIILVAVILAAALANAENVIDAPVGPGPAVEIPADTTPPPPPTPETAEPAPVAKKKSAKKNVADKSVKDDDGGNGDTYNFYFQKGSGPGSVEQGRDHQKVDGAAEKTETRKAPNQDEAFFLPRFEAQAGLFFTPASSGSGLALGGQFNATRSIGFQVHLISMHFDQKSTTSSFTAAGSQDGTISSSATGGSAALVYTPLTIAESSMPVRISALAGALMVTTTTDSTQHNFSAEGSNDTTASNKESKVLGFVGISATAYISKHFGISGYGKITSDPNYSQIGLSAAWLL